MTLSEGQGLSKGTGMQVCRTDPKNDCGSKSYTSFLEFPQDNRKAGTTLSATYEMGLRRKTFDSVQKLPPKKVLELVWT